MPTPFELLTKPLRIGAQIAFGAIQNIQQAVQGLTGGGEPPRRPQPKPLDDVTITRKVETVLFRDASADKGKISVDSADGVVTLRGEAKTPTQITQFEASVRQIPEVRDVENLLHLPKTPARSATRRKTAPRKRPAKRTTAERKPSTPAAEPTPKDLAEKGEGRQPAPFGASDG